MIMGIMLFLNLTGFGQKADSTITQEKLIGDFNFSEYDDAQRLMAVESRVEITGGYFTKGSPGFQRAEFVLEGGIQIDNNKYYKLSDNPSAFRRPAARQKK